MGVNREFNLDWIITAVSSNSYEINVFMLFQVLWHGVHGHQSGQKHNFYKKWWEKTRIESHGVVCVSRSSVVFLHIWKSWRISLNQETQSHVRTGSAAMSDIYRDTLHKKFVLKWISNTWLENDYMMWLWEHDTRVFISTKLLIKNKNNIINIKNPEQPQLSNQCLIPWYC